MISDVVARKNVLTFSLVASILFILQGCIATRDWVAEQLSPRDKRVAEAEGRLDKTDSRVSGAENRISGAEGRIGQVDAKAEKALSSLANLRLQRRLGGCLQALHYTRISRMVHPHRCCCRGITPRI